MCVYVFICINEIYNIESSYCLINQRRLIMDVFLFFVGWFSISLHLVKGHHESGFMFISVDCGIAEGSDYTDDKTGLFYKSDVGFTDTGNNEKISQVYMSSGLSPQLSTMRSFPEGINNCYTLKPEHANGNKYLIRAIFMYGNYDSRNQPPEFALYLEENEWAKVKMVNASHVVIKEIIHVRKTEYIHVCLVNINSGTPFISALEIRQLNNSIYVTENGSLLLNRRIDVGSTSLEIARYKSDMYDRIWETYNSSYMEPIGALYDNDDSELLSNNIYRPPSRIMRTAVKPINGTRSLDFNFNQAGSSDRFYVYMYFSEVEELQENQLRKFKISLNDDKWFGPLVPRPLSPVTIYNTHSISGNPLRLSIYMTNDSTLPPILNALEIYTVKEFLQSPTNPNEVDAARELKSVYGIGRNWQGDPCVPRIYSWDGFVCNYYDYDSPVIISLNLSSSSLIGKLVPAFSKFKSLQYLDLSNNSLTGSVPDSLGQLPSLKTLNLSGNKLRGAVPSELIEKSRNRSLLLSVDGNQNLCQGISCGKKNNSTKVVVASVASCLALIVALALFWWLKLKKSQVLEIFQKPNEKDEIMGCKSRQFTYSEVVKVTDNFQKILGKGGFGTVYGGCLDDGTQVAVKMLSPSSTQGLKQFRTEAQLLNKVHHRNLTSLIGYCNEGLQMGLIYDYMANGNLQEHLSVKSESFLSWKQRLRIAVDAAQALEYLHNGCKPPIIHRDVKTSNILLTTNLEAKVADFGLSRLMTLENESHISTTVVGTLGYLDPEYCLTNKLNSKSDVYSFGVVLLELITGKPAVLRGHGDIESLVQWVNPMLERGEIRTIFDSRMEDDFDTSSAWKALEIATACVFPSFIQRPNMSQVLAELKECLELETLTHQRNSSSTVVEEDLYHLDLYQPPPAYYSATAAAAGLEGFMGPLAR